MWWLRASVAAMEATLSAPAATRAKLDALPVYYLLFFMSGFPALLYQIVWQRALFTLYGVNVESVTMIVTVFMLGLGLGSLFGGWLSTRKGMRLLLAFGVIEFSVGLFGAASLAIFHRVGAWTAGGSTTATGSPPSFCCWFPPCSWAARCLCLLSTLSGGRAMWASRWGCFTQ